MTRLYYRPIARCDAPRPRGALRLAGGWCWFDTVEVLCRGQAPQMIAAAELPEAALVRLTAPRPAVAGLAWDRPLVMGIVNLTPDSFSDGGRFDAPGVAVARAGALRDAGADLLDLGGESTRPGALAVAPEAEVMRVVPVISALRAAGFDVPISVDTRKAEVARATLKAGADIINDVSAMEYDPEMLSALVQSGAPVCLMHAQGLPETMQQDPRYGDVLLDVYDYLEARIAYAEAAGISRARIFVDPGIGFGKTVAHNLALIRGLSLFHGFGCGVLLGVSRKRFIGEIGRAAEAGARAPGTLAVTLAGLAQGIQMHRVHDVSEIAQGVRLWAAITGESDVS